MVVIVIILLHIAFRWAHGLAVRNLNKINATNFKFKKVLDCSQDAICIVNNN